TASLSILLASFGSSSETWMPATFVAIGLKLLFVFGSKVSTWLGPPSSQKRITAFALALTSDLAAAAARYSCMVRPRNPREPTVRNSLRDVEYFAMTILLS